MTLDLNWKHKEKGRKHKLKLFYVLHWDYSGLVSLLTAQQSSSETKQKKKQDKVTILIWKKINVERDV